MYFALSDNVGYTITPKAVNNGQLVPVVRSVDSVIHCINHNPLDNSIGCAIVFIRWIVIYPVDSVIHLLNNRDLVSSSSSRIHLLPKTERN